MEDLIKREDAIEVIKGNSYLDDDYIEINGYGAIEDIRTLPSADRPQEWIPCSERLPKGTDGISDCEMVLMTLSLGYVSCGWINGDTAYVLIDNPVYDQIVIKDREDVLAWMPLPPAYKEGE